MKGDVLVEGINDELGERVKQFTAQFYTEQNISLHVFKPVLSSTRDVPNTVNGPVKVHHLEPKFVFEVPVLRALLAEASNIFFELQRNVQNEKLKTDFLKFSLTYRSSIRACSENLQQLIMESDAEAETYQNFITILYGIECIWHLCERLFINKSGEGMIVQHLLEWVRFHFPASERSALELLQMGHEADKDENYWTTVKDLISKGQLEVARTLLKMSSSADTSAYQEADRILSTMPMYNVYGGLSVQKFRTQWRYWVENAKSKIHHGLLAAEPELEEVLKVVIGDYDTWKKLCIESSSWYEYFPGYLLYTEPTCKDFELPQFVNIWLGQWWTRRSMTMLDQVLLHVMKNNLNQVLHDIQNMGDNKWFVTHLTDLLYHSGQLEAFGDSNQNLDDLRDRLIFDFGTNLMSQKSFWQFGIGYLEYCKEGPPARELLLARIPFDTDREASKLISAARRIECPQIETQICRVMAQKSIKTSRYGNALQWAIRSNDKIYITKIVDYFLEHYTKTGEMLCQDTLSNVGPRMFICPRLMFLVKYYDFHQYYRERAFSQAGELLINLLDSNITPPFFWSSLLADTIPLLEFEEPIIPSKETLKILHHVESDLMPLIERKKKELIQSMETDDAILSNTLHGKPEDLVQLLRLSCARNLGRALIIENTIG